MRANGNKKRKTRSFVPRSVLGTICVGVIPACVLECGGDDSTGRGYDGGWAGVAACCFEGGAVAVDAFAGDRAHDSPLDAHDAAGGDASDAADTGGEGGG